MTRLRAALILAVLALAVGATAVVAAPDPPAGEVSKAAPTTSFAGEITEPTGAFEIQAQENGGTGGDCPEPMCQEFALTVKDPGVALSVDSVVDEDGFSQTVEIEDPDGKVSQTSASDPGTVKAKVVNPKAGAWIIRLYGSDYVDGPNATWTYKATVKLTTNAPADPAPEPQATVTPGPGGTGGQNASTGGGGAAASPVTLKIAKPKLSAKKLKKARSVTLKLSSSAAVNNVQVSVATGSAAKPKLQGRATAARVANTATVKIKLRRALEKGTALRISARGTDEQGRTVSGSATAKVSR